jgi:hypothetical protein
VISAPFTLLAFPEPGDPETACTVSHDGQHHLTQHDKHVQPLAHAFTTLSQAALPSCASAKLISDLVSQHGR